MTIDTAIENAKLHFEEGYNCAQAVFRVVAEEKGFYFGNIPILTAGFGGGIGLEGKTCGAVIGAVMALGMILGEEEKDPVNVKEKAYEYTPQLLRQFRKIHGTTICSELLEIDMMNPEERKKASDTNLFYEVCPKFLESAVRIILELKLK